MSCHLRKLWFGLHGVKIFFPVWSACYEDGDLSLAYTDVMSVSNTAIMSPPLVGCITEHAVA